MEPMWTNLVQITQKKVELEEAKVERVEKKKSGNKMKAYVQMQK